MTYTVLGNYAGGTTALTGLLMLMDIYMGDNLDPNCLEDLDLRRKSISEIKKIVKKRNKNHDVWGWKDPQLALRVEDIAPLLKEPRFIAILRDPYAKAYTEKKRGYEIMKQAKVCNKTNWRILRFLETHNYPYHLMSYEHLMRHKDREIKRLAEFVNYEIKDIDKLTGYLRPQDTAELTNLEYIQCADS